MKNFEAIVHNSFFMSSSKKFIELLFFYLQTIRAMSSYKRYSEIL